MFCALNGATRDALALEPAADRGGRRRSCRRRTPCRRSGPRPSSPHHREHRGGRARCGARAGSPARHRRARARARAELRPVLDLAGVRERAAEPEPERPGERGLDHARRSGCGCFGGAVAPRARSAPRPARRRTVSAAAEPRGGPVRDVVGARRRGAEPGVALVAAADHRVERVHRAVREHARARRRRRPRTAARSRRRRCSPRPTRSPPRTAPRRRGARGRARRASGSATRARRRFVARSTRSATACASRASDRPPRATYSAMPRAERARQHALERRAEQRGAADEHPGVHGARRSAWAGRRRARTRAAARPNPATGCKRRGSPNSASAPTPSTMPAAVTRAPSPPRRRPRLPPPSRREPRAAWPSIFAVVHAGDGPAAVVGVELGDRQGGDVDAPERARRGVQRGHDRGLDHAAVGDGDRGAVQRRLLRQPRAHAGEQRGQGLAAVGRGVRVGHPGLHRGRVLSGELRQRPAGPGAEVALGQRGIDGATVNPAAVWSRAPGRRDQHVDRGGAAQRRRAAASTPAPSKSSSAPNAAARTAAVEA